MRKICIVFLLLMLLSACTSVQEAPANVPDMSITADVPVKSAPQEVEAPPADAAPEAPLQTEPETPAEPELVLDEETKDYVRWSALTGLQEGKPEGRRDYFSSEPQLPFGKIGEPIINIWFEETRSASTYFSCIRDENVSRFDTWSEDIWNGFYLFKGDQHWTADDVIDDHLYIGRQLCRYQGMDNWLKHFPYWELTDYPVGEYGRTLQKIYYLTPDGTQLMQMEADGSDVTCIYAAPDGTLYNLRCGNHVIWCAEQMADETWRVWRMYTPDLNADNAAERLTVLETGIASRPYIQVKSNCETVVSWTNPEMTRKREELKEEYWTELWENQTEQEREWFISRYLDAHPDYVDDGGVPPYDEDMIPQGSMDMIIAWIFERYGVPVEFVRYYNTITGYRKMMTYVPGTRQYYTMDGTPWERPYEMDGDEVTEGSPFWLYLPPDSES